MLNFASKDRFSPQKPTLAAQGLHNMAKFGEADSHKGVPGRQGK